MVMPELIENSYVRLFSYEDNEDETFVTIILRQKFSCKYFQRHFFNNQDNQKRGHRKKIFGFFNGIWRLRGEGR